MIRYVIPKGTSLEQFTQEEISLMMNHINSYARKSLFGKTPYDIAKRVFPEDFFDMPGTAPSHFNTRINKDISRT